MRALLQRVTSASVRVEGEVVGAIGPGLLILVGVAQGDSDADLQRLVDKIAGLRIFADAQGKMNLAVTDVRGACLVISQFTLFADCRKGRRPFFGGAESPERAAQMCEAFAQRLRETHALEVATGRFGAMMQVELVNDGPVTLWLDTSFLGPAH